jgi:hypothetical protein
MKLTVVVAGMTIPSTTRDIKSLDGSGVTVNDWSFP